MDRRATERPGSCLPLDELPSLQALVARLGEHGDGPALVAFDREGTTEWSFAELARDAARVAAGLAARGVEPGDRVAVYAEDSPRWILAALGALRLGAVVMPVDAQLDDRSLAHVLEDGAPRLVCTSEGLAGRAAEALTEAPPQALLDGADADWDALLGDEGEAPEPARGADDPAMLFYTSGTTGPPKGVPLTGRNLLFQLQVIAEAGIAGPGDRVLLPLPLHHVYPVVMGLLAPLALGIPVILPRSLTGPQVLRALQEGRPTVVIGVPRLYQSLAENIERQAAAGGALARGGYRAALAVSRAWLRVTGRQAGRRLLAPVHREIGPSLRLLASGGSPLDPALARHLRALGWQVGVGYGLTETSPLLTLNLPGDFDPETVGRPVRDTEVRVDRRAGPEGDEEGSAGEPLAPDPTDQPGVEGEIVARGPGVFHGYRGLPEKTREALVEGWYRTGDLGRFDRAGRLAVLGRRSTLLVTPGGENVQPDTLEEAYAAHPAIREVGVLQDEGGLAALVVPDSGTLRDADDPREAVGAALKAAGRKLPSYQRLGAFQVTREALPRTRLGKIRRAELEARYGAARDAGGEAAARREPQPVEEMSGSDRALLEDPTARAVWDWLAGRYPEQGLTPDTSPEVDLGVDSMSWVDLTLEISERTGVEVDEDAIAGVETVRDLLEAVVDARREGAEGGLDLGADPEAHLAPDQARWLDPPGPAGQAAGRVLHALDRALLRLFRVRVEGRDRLPAPDEPVVIAPNHMSVLDPFVVAAALPWARLRHTHWAGWVGIAFTNALTRAFSRVTRTFPVDPERGMLSALALGAASLQRGDSLVWFPEGQRSEDGSLRPFKPGLGIILESRPATVVPVHIAGTREALPPGSLRPRPGRRIRVRFGEPVTVADLDGEGEGEERRARLMDALRRRLEALGAAD